MSIDIHREELWPLGEYARRRPPGRGGKRMHIATAYRHVHQGVRGIKLEAIRIGGCLYTSREAVERWVEKLSTGEIEPVMAPASDDRRRSAERADRELKDLGL